jgi:hypothetical protein
MARTGKQANFHERSNTRADLSVALSVEGTPIKKIEGRQKGRSSSVATPCGDVAASTAAR